MLFSIVSLLTAASTFQPVVTQRVYSPDSSELRMELGTLSQPLTGELSSAARAWALTERARYGLPLASTLRNTESFGTKLGASFHLAQEVAGVDVYGAKLVVTIDRNAQVVQVSSSLQPYERALVEWNIGVNEALLRAAARVPFPVMRRDGSALPYGGAKKQLFAVGADLHAGYLVHIPSLDLAKNWYLAVDAVTGEILFMQNRVHTAALDAKVYPVSPGGFDAGVGVAPTVTRPLQHADGGSMIAGTCEASLPDGGVVVTPNDGGMLCGTQLITFNCCPTAGCVPDAGVRRAAGATVLQFGGQPVPVQYDIAVCDRYRRATNDPATHTSGTYEYTPVDPPVDAGFIDPYDLSNSDEFAEVHAFYHVNRVYDWVRGLSAAAAPIFPTNQPAIVPFAMRDERRTPARRVAVWANVMFPNFQELIASAPGCLFAPPCVANSLTRVDNAAFFPVEQFDQIPLPEFNTGVDTLMIFQGNSADAAYDATVIQHEFGHGVVYATAALTFDAIAIDQRSANNESGALHEGFADYIAGAFNDLAEMGPYFGPRALAGANVPGVGQESFLRTMNNTFTCPTVLWGEVHQDSQHVAAALWRGRATFPGTDQGATFDAAFYAMLVSLAPTADFAQVAAAMSDKVGRAFPLIATASAQMTQIFTDKGVISCSKIIDVTGAGPRPYYGIPSAPTSLAQSLIPGPYQMKLRTPNGVSKVRVAARVQANQNPLAGNTGPITVLVKSDQPVTFTRNGNNLVNDNERQATAAPAGGNFNATVDIDVLCGASREVYVTLANTGGGATLQQLSVTFDPRANCLVGTDGGTDGGVDGGVDGGETTTVGSVGANGIVAEHLAKTGCGCTSGFDLVPIAAIALLRLLRRRRAD